MKTFGEMIRDCRVDLDLTQKEFAALFEKSQATIVSWEKNIAFPTKKLYPKVAEILKIEEVYLYQVIKKSKNLKNEEYEQLLIKINSNESVEELQKIYKFEIDGKEITPEELKEMLDSLVYYRFKESKKQNKKKIYNLLRYEETK